MCFILIFILVYFFYFLSLIQFNFVLHYVISSLSLRLLNFVKLNRGFRLVGSCR